MEHACENADNLLEEILVCLLRATSSETAYAALDKINNSEKKERIKKQVFPDLLSHQELEALSSTSLPMLEPLEVEEFFSILSEVTDFNEEDICQCLVEGCEEKLCSFLDEGLSPDYIFTQDVLIEGFVCLQGSSLLLCTLQACIQKNSSNVLYNIVALLLERGVDLEKECLGIDPLSYLCENEDCFPKELILCLLTSVSSRKAFAVLAKVPDSDRRKHLEEVLRSNLSCFQFDPDLEREQEVLEQSMPVLLQDTLPSSNLSEIQMSITSSEKIDLKELVSSIYSSDLKLLERILKSPFLLREYNKEVQSKDSKGTLFSFLMFKVENVFRRHDMCLLFLKHGHTPETIVKGNITMAGLLCSLRRKVFLSEDNKFHGVLMATLYALFFLFKEGTSIKAKAILANLVNRQDETLLTDFFIDKETKLFSKQSINFVDLVKKDRSFNYNFCYLLEGFLDASLTINKNVITEESWDIEYLFPLFNCVKNKLCNFSQQGCPSQRRKGVVLFRILESLLLATVHENSFDRNKITFYYQILFQSTFFKNLEIRRKVLSLVGKYWGTILNQTSQLFLSENIELEQENSDMIGKTLVSLKRKNQEEEQDSVKRRKF